MNVDRFSRCSSFKKIRPIVTEKEPSQPKVVCGSPSKKGFQPLSLELVQGKKPEERNDKNKKKVLNVEQLLEGLSGLELMHSHFHDRYARE